MPLPLCVCVQAPGSPEGGAGPSSPAQAAGGAAGPPRGSVKGVKSVGVAAARASKQVLVQRHLTEGAILRALY